MRNDLKNRIRRRVPLLRPQRPGPGPLIDRSVAEARGELVVGEHTYGNPKIRRSRGDTGRVHIGKFCSIALDVEVFIGGNHPVNWVSTYPFRARFDLPGAYADGLPATHGDVRIENDVWLGTGATIMSGVTIENGAVVAARSVVTRDVPPFTIVGGNPAREIRHRFSPQQIEALQRIGWWDWQLPKIMVEVPLLSSVNVDEFIAKFG